MLSTPQIEQKFIVESSNIISYALYIYTNLLNGFDSKNSSRIYSTYNIIH